MPKIEAGKTRLGWVGTGVMGSAMAGHLLKAGFALTVFNRTKSKAEPLLAQGAKWADTPKSVAAAADVVFAIVGFPSDVREVMLGAEGALAGSKSGNILVDMTTSEPSLAVEIAEAAKQKSVSSVDAPVSGGDVGAKNATLSIMIGGDKDVVESLSPCFQAMGKTIVYQGGPGSGQHTKMVNQILIATNMIGVCEALLYGYKARLDLPTVLQSVGSGAAVLQQLRPDGDGRLRDSGRMPSRRCTRQHRPATAACAGVHPRRGASRCSRRYGWRDLHWRRRRGHWLLASFRAHGGEIRARPSRRHRSVRACVSQRRSGTVPARRLD